jgi:cell division protein FtsB
MRNIARRVIGKEEYPTLEMYIEELPDDVRNAAARVRDLYARITELNKEIEKLRREAKPLIDEVTEYAEKEYGTRVRKNVENIQEAEKILEAAKHKFRFIAKGLSKGVSLIIRFFERRSPVKKEVLIEAARKYLEKVLREVGANLEMYIRYMEEFDSLIKELEEATEVSKIEQVELKVKEESFRRPAYRKPAYRRYAGFREFISNLGEKFRSFVQKVKNFIFDLTHTEEVVEEAYKELEDALSLAETEPIAASRRRYAKTEEVRLNRVAMLLREALRELKRR